ncbi:MAG: PA14 domain-containing protein [Pirellula sp.]
MRFANRRTLRTLTLFKVRRRRTKAYVRRLQVEGLEARQLLASDTTSGIGLLGQYFNNSNLTDLAIVRNDPNIAFNWGIGSPDVLIGADTFSARWSGQLEAVYTESYRFYVSADNGFRLWINGQMLVDSWTDLPINNAQGTIDLVAGRKYDVLLEYYESTGNAAIQWEWSSPSQARVVVPTTRLFPSERGNVLRETWTNVNGNSVSNLTSLATYPASPNSVSMSASFQSQINQADNFGERLRGWLHPPATGDYTFFIAGDDSAELWLSNSADSQNKQLIATVPSPTLANEWTAFPSQRSGIVKLVTGQSYYVEVLHKDGTGSDHVNVGWLAPSAPSIEAIDRIFLSPVLPEVSAFAEQATTAEGNNQAARLRLLRTGAPINNPLTVSYSLRGTAINGVDYVSLSGIQVIPAGQDSVVVDIQSIADGQVEGNESVVLEIVDGSGYLLGGISNRSATLTIQDNVSAPSGGLSVLAGTALSNFIAFGGTFSAFTDPVHGPAIGANITSLPANPWDAQLRQNINVPVNAGDILYAEFLARSASADSASLSAIFERDGGSFQKSLSQNVSLSSVWTKIQLPFVAAESYAIGQAAFTFHLGTKLQSIQFSQIIVRNYGPASLLAKIDNFTLLNIGGSYGSMIKEPVTGQPFSQALTITTHSMPPQVWHLQALARNAGATVAGDVIRLEFWARGTAGTNPRLDAAIQESFGSFNTLSFNSPVLTSNWQKFTYDVTTTAAYAVETLQVSLNAGFSPQTIQVGGITWTNRTRGVEFASLPKQVPIASYDGRSGNSTWRSDADDRIAQVRKANLTVNVVDSFGNPIDGAVVQVRQKEHAFRFGSAINGYDNLLVANGTAESMRYQSEIRRLFNAVTIENNLKWPNFAASRQLGIDAANWAAANNLALRGHNIIWPSRTFMPTNVWTQYDSTLASQGAQAAATYLRNTINARIVDVASTFQGKTLSWDIVNEPFSNRDAMTVLGDDELLEWFRLFRTQNSTSLRTLNDYDIFARNGANTAHRTNYDNWLTRLKSQNLIEMIGEQSHYQESNLTGIAILGQLIQTYFNQFALPIGITEFDISSSDQQLQADYLRDYMTMAFSQPSVSEFVQWGFWSKSHYQPGAALYNDDFSIRPNGQAYEDLAFGEFWTDTRGTTRAGSFAANVFKGDYEITVTLGSQSVTSYVSGFNSNGSVSVKLHGLQLLVPMYEYPLASQVVLNPWWQQVLNGASAATPITIIANPNSGPILASHPSYNDWINGLSLLRQNPNIRILGYVSTRISPTSQTVRSASEILSNVGLYGSLYKHPSSGASLIDGIFLDEMSNLVDNVATYATVAAGIRTTPGLGGRMIFANPGTSVPIEYLDQKTADVFVVREGRPNDLLLNSVPDYVSSPGYAHLSFGAIVHEAIGNASLAQMLREIKLRKLDYAFITDDIDNPSTSTDSPYDRSPNYFVDELRDLHSPYVGARSFSIAEHSAIGTVLGSPTSGDPDLGQRLNYSIVSGNANNVFAMDPLSGQLRIANSGALDFESTPVFNLVINAVDNGSPLLNDSNTITVQLDNINDAPSAIAGGPYNAVEGLPVNFSGSGTDQDAGSTLTYAWDFNYDGVNFDVDANGANPSSIFPDNGNRAIALRVSDNGLPPKSTIATASLTIANAPPLLTRSLASVNGNALSLLSNTGTWQDVLGDNVTISASMGTVVKNADGTWFWSMTPSVGMNSQIVTVTATDKDGASTNVSFSLTAFVVIMRQNVYYAGSTYASLGGVDAAVDPSKTVAKAISTSQTLSTANVINYSRGINALLFDVAGLASSSLVASDFVFRTAPSSVSGAVTPGNWPIAPNPSSIVVIPGTATSPARILIEWPDNAIQNTWLQIIVKANAATGLINQQVYYLGHAFADINLASPYRVTAVDLSAVQSAIATTIRTVDDPRDLNKDRRVTAADLSLVQSNISNTVLLQDIIIPSYGSIGEGEGETGATRNASIGSVPSPRVNNREARLTSIDAYFAAYVIDEWSEREFSSIHRRQKNGWAKR